MEIVSATCTKSRYEKCSSFDGMVAGFSYRILMDIHLVRFEGNQILSSHRFLKLLDIQLDIFNLDVSGIYPTANQAFPLCLIEPLL